MSGRQIKKGLAHDGVIADVELVAVFEYEHGWWLGGLGNRVRHGALRRVRGARILHRRNVGFRAATAAVEDGGATLIVGVIGIGISIAWRVRGIGHRDRVEASDEGGEKIVRPAMVLAMIAIVPGGKLDTGVRRKSHWS